MMVMRHLIMRCGIFIAVFDKIRLHLLIGWYLILTSV